VFFAAVSPDPDVEDGKPEQFSLITSKAPHPSQFFAG
jgi:hypothetical protein